MRGVIALLLTLLTSVAGAGDLQTVAITRFAFHIDERLVAGMHVLNPGGSATLGETTGGEPGVDWLDHVIDETEASFSDLLGVELVHTNRRHAAFPPAPDMIAGLPLTPRSRAFKEGGYDAVVELRVEISTSGRWAARGPGSSANAPATPKIVLQGRVVRADGRVLWRGRVKVRHDRPLRQTTASVSYGTYVTRWETLPPAEIVDLYTRAVRELVRSQSE